VLGGAGSGSSGSVVSGGDPALHLERGKLRLTCWTGSPMSRGDIEPLALFGDEDVREVGFLVVDGHLVVFGTHRVGRHGLHPVLATDLVVAWLAVPSHSSCFAHQVGAFTGFGFGDPGSLVCMKRQQQGGDEAEHVLVHLVWGGERGLSLESSVQDRCQIRRACAWSRREQSERRF
jgi:hypothetical protein